MRSSTTLAFAAATLAAFVVSDSLAAQSSTTRGLTLGLHVSGASLSVEGDDRSNAGGGGIRVGYGVNRRITIFGQADGAEFDVESTGDIQGTWTMGHFDLGVRFNFANSLKSYVPFLVGAVGARAVTVNDPIVNNTMEEKVSLSGSAVTLGGGVDIYLSEGFALDLELLWTGGQFTTVTINNLSATGFDTDAQSTRFNVGVSWWP